MVAQKPVQRGSFSLGHAGSSGIIILLHRAGRAGPLEVIPDVRGSDAAHHALHPVAVAIVNKRGAGRPADRGHAVLSIIRVAGGAARAHHNPLDPNDQMQPTFTPCLSRRYQPTHKQTESIIR